MTRRRRRRKRRKSSTIRTTCYRARMASKKLTQSRSVCSFFSRLPKCIGRVAVQAWHYCPVEEGFVLGDAGAAAAWREAPWDDLDFNRFGMAVYFKLPGSLDRPLKHVPCIKASPSIPIPIPTPQPDPNQEPEHSSEPNP